MIPVFFDKRKKRACFRFEPGSGQFLRVFIGLLGIDEAPAHQSSVKSHASTGVAIPSRILSRMPGMLTRYSVSCIADQSLSDSNTALLRLPVICNGSCDAAASSISRY